MATSVFPRPLSVHRIFISFLCRRGIASIAQNNTKALHERQEIIVSTENRTEFQNKLLHGPSLSDFIAGSSTSQTIESDDRVNVATLSKVQLKEQLENLGFPKYRASQIWHAVYSRGARTFDEVSVVGKNDRSRLKDYFTIDFGDVRSDKESGDGTRKWLIHLDAGRFRPSDSDKTKTDATVESVYIPELERGTVCVSSQVGCSLSCSFCHTGTQKLERNLSAGEIVSQLMVCRHSIGEFPLGAPNGTKQRMASNIVFMGQGEPLYNFRNVSRAIDILSDEEGSPRMSIAISLHSANRDTRNELVPLNKTYPFEDMLSLCRSLSRDNSLNLRRRRILFEYVLIDGVNDRKADAKDLAHSLKGISGLVNLIPFNTWPGTPYSDEYGSEHLLIYFICRCSSTETILAFAEELKSRGVQATVRWPRGRDILAACGQLRSTELLKLRAKKRLLGERATVAP